MNTEDKICKICHAGGTEDDILIYPCKCDGSMKYTHKSCLFMFINSSKKEYCTICKHKYIFKDIYKEGTPSRLPLRLIIKDAGTLIKNHLAIICKILLSLFIAFTAIFINGSMFLTACGFSIKDVHNFPILGFFSGTFVSITSFLLYYLYDKVSRARRTRIMRRNIRIDSMSVMSSMASEALSQGDAPRIAISNIATELDASFLSIDGLDMNSTVTGLSNLPVVDNQVNNNENDQINNENDQINNENNQINEESSMEDLDRIDIEVISIQIDWSLIPKCCNMIFPLVAVIKILEYANFDLPDYHFTRFLKEVYLYDLTKDFILFYFMFFLTIISARKWRKMYEFLKMLNLIFVCSAVVVFVDGLLIHFLFSEITCNGIIYDFQKPVYSFFFHMFIGFSFSSFFKHFLIPYSDKFRPGLFWTLAEPNSSTFEFIYKLSRRSLFVTYSKMIKSLIYHMSVVAIFFKMIQPEISRKLFIRDIYEFLLIFKSKRYLIGSLKSVFLHTTSLNTCIIKYFSRFINMQNYLFNDPVKQNITLKWCPNKHKFYDLDLVTKQYKKRVSSTDVDRFYLKSHNNDFGLFHVPEYCVLYLNLIALFVTFSTSLVIRLLLRATTLLTLCVVSRFPIISDYDGYLYFFVVLILSSFTSLNIYKNFLKRALMLLYIDIIFPLWATLVIIILYGTKKLTVIPSITFMLFLMCSDILNFIAYRFVFPISIENYSFSYITRVFNSIFTSTTVLICACTYLHPFLDIFYEYSVKRPTLYIYLGILMVFIYNGKVFKRFLDDVRRNNYLVERDVVNYDI